MLASTQIYLSIYISIYRPLRTILHRGWQEVTIFFSFLKVENVFQVFFKNKTKISRIKLKFYLQ